jgi:hypothetical protein
VSSTPDIATMIDEAVEAHGIMRATELHEALVMQVEHLWNRGYRSSEIARVLRFVIAEYLDE